MENKYNKISKLEDYNSILKSGLFFELFTELSGEYDKDIITIYFLKDIPIFVKKSLILNEIPEL